jgi:hypothetical protein
MPDFCDDDGTGSGGSMLESMLESMLNAAPRHDRSAKREGNHPFFGRNPATFDRSALAETSAKPVDFC